MALLIAACGAAPVKRDGPLDGPAPPWEKDRPPPAHTIPLEVHLTPDAEPRWEPRSRYGNPASYQVFGRTYYVKDSAEGYRERGMASWYGQKFQGRRTSSGEPYDMFAMTAAHKSLPLPSYVRVTHLGNGRSIVVRVNDRGPFHPGRIIDLSYAAAARLDMLTDGEAPVEVEAIVLASREAPPQADPRYLEAGTFGDPVAAVALREQLFLLGFELVELRVETRGDEYLHRVLVGPYPAPPALEAAQRQLLENRIQVRPVYE